MTTEVLFTHIHTVSELTPDGGLKVTTPKGREVIYKPEEVAQTLLRRFEDQDMPNGLQSVAAALSSQLQAVNRAQAGDAMRLLWAGVTIARDLDPNFDAEGRTLEVKLQDAEKVIDSAGRALVGLERHQTVAAQHDFLQNVLATSAEYLAQGIFNTYLNPGARGQLLELLRKTTNLALLNIAGEIPPEAAARGAENIRMAEETMALARESRPRAKIGTKMEGLDLEAGKEKVRDMKRKLDDERVHADRLRLQELNERRLNQLGKWAREQAGAFGGWWKETVGEALSGTKELFFEPEEGLVVRFFDSIGKSWNVVAEHVSTPMVAGLGIGGSIGVTFGFNLGIGTLKAVEAVMEVSGVEAAVIWIPTALMGLGLGAGGGYIGYKLDEWIKSRTKIRQSKATARRPAAASPRVELDEDEEDFTKDEE